jgi:hypothetical protein
VDRGKVTALDLVQHGLADDAEDRGGLVQFDPALGDLGDDTVADGLVDPDPPGCVRSELLTSEKPVPNDKNPAARAGAEALGRSRGGLTTKIHLVAARPRGNRQRPAPSCQGAGPLRVWWMPGCAPPITPAWF